MNVIVIIPARGGSKGIPRKNIRVLAGKPLISYAIETALTSNYINKVVVTTEDEEISEIAEVYGSEVVKRPKNLSEDITPLDPVIFHTLKFIEDRDKEKYDLVVTLQPTSPLLTTKTLDNGIEKMLNEDFDTLISVKDETHLYWKKKDNKYVPLYEERRNRQYLDPIYKETGALLISRRDVISEKSRIGENIELFELPEEESVDIDTFRDWWVAENLLKRLKIVFRVDGDSEIGLGHVYRMITLANIIFNHKIVFLIQENKQLGIDKIKEYNYPVVTFTNDTDLFEKLKDINPHIVINDILDTDKNYIMNLKKEGVFVINFEDLGEGSEFADLVINALYENSYPPENHYYGYRYVCLRDEFYIFPRKEVKEDVKRISVTFGGTDPNNLTMKALKAIENLNINNIHVKVILGLGYQQKEDLRNYLSELKKKGFSVDIAENVKMMSKELYYSDIVITSNGRTIYEAASIGTPCISISQNEREVRHLFAHNSRGIKNLGIAYTVSVEDIAHAVDELIENFDLRKKMNENLLKFNLRKGRERVLNLIFEKYWELMNNEGNKN